MSGFAWKSAAVAKWTPMQSRRIGLTLLPFFWGALCDKTRPDRTAAETHAMAHVQAQAASRGLHEPEAAKIGAIRDLARWGFLGEAPPPLARFVVELDQRILTELARTAVLFVDLFEDAGRHRLVKVGTQTIPCSHRSWRRALSCC